MNELAAKKDHILSEILRLLGERYEAGCLEWASVHDRAAYDEIGRLEARVNDNFRAGGPVEDLKAHLRAYWQYHMKVIRAFKAAHEKEETVLSVEGISALTLARFERRDLAVEIESYILKTRIWLCSNEGMRSRVLIDDPEAVCYLPGELKEIVKASLRPESLRAIHDAKLVFPGARLRELIEKKDSGTEEEARKKELDSAHIYP